MGGGLDQTGDVSCGLVLGQPAGFIEEREASRMVRLECLDAWMKQKSNDDSRAQEDCSCQPWGELNSWRTYLKTG